MGQKLTDAERAKRYREKHAEKVRQVDRARKAEGRQEARDGQVPLSSRGQRDRHGKPFKTVSVDDLQPIHREGGRPDATAAELVSQATYREAPSDPSFVGAIHDEAAGGARFDWDDERLDRLSKRYDDDARAWAVRNLHVSDLRQKIADLDTLLPLTTDQHVREMVAQSRAIYAGQLTQLYLGENPPKVDTEPSQKVA
jgi:hypothetical protein